MPPPPRPLELTSGTEAEPRTFLMPPAAAPADVPPEEERPAAPPAHEEPADSDAVESAGRTLPWEIEALTAPDYTAPRSIHDPEHDSWPVAAPDGAAMPAWEADAAGAELELTDVVEELEDTLELTDVALGDAAHEEDAPQLELTDVVGTEDVAAAAETEQPADAAADEHGTPAVPYIDAVTTPGAGFPLDAFIVPRGVEHAPAGYLEEIGTVVADRLEALAGRIRTEGIQSVGQVDDADELARVLGAVVAGYLARRA